MLVPAEVVVARKLMGKPITWSDCARAILREANFYGYRPWYVKYRIEHCSFILYPKHRYDHTYHVSPHYDGKTWIFEVIG